MKKVVLAIALWIISTGMLFAEESSGPLMNNSKDPQVQTQLPLERQATPMLENAGLPPKAAAQASMGVSKNEAQPDVATGAAKSGPSGETPVVTFLLGTTLLGAEWVLWLLLALSVASGAIILDRILFFNRIKVNFTTFVTELARTLNNDDMEGVGALCQRFGHCLESEIVAVALANRAKGAAAIEKSMTGYLAWQRHKLDKGLTFLGTLGNNAPFIGLFGTVLGIIQAFHQLALNPTGGSAVVMSGISSALVATAVGLFVAIPAVLAFNSFQRVVKRKLANAEAVQDLMMMHFSAQSRSRPMDQTEEQKHVV